MPIIAQFTGGVKQAVNRIGLQMKVPPMDEHSMIYVPGNCKQPYFAVQWLQIPALYGFPPPSRGIFDTVQEQDGTE